MAKTRKKPAKRPRPARRATTKKTTRRKAASPRRSQAPEVLNLKLLQDQLRRAVASLSNREPSTKVADTQAKLARWDGEIASFCEGSEICGPTMEIPL